MPASLAPTVLPLLVGIHYFGGWWHGSNSHWERPTPWLPSYPSRTPLLGMYTTDQATVDAEIAAAEAHGVSYFDVLYYDRERCAGAPQLNASQFLFARSATLNASTHFSFMFTWSNDEHSAFSDGAWAYAVGQWVHAMTHPRYLRVGGRPVFKILQGDTFFQNGCGGNATLVQARITALRSAARSAGVGEIVIGVSWVQPFQPLPYLPGVTAWLGFTPDFLGTYNDAFDGRLPKYRQPGVVFPYATDCAPFQDVARLNHSHDALPYLPNTPASFDPRPWGERASSFTFPTRDEWTSEMRNLTGTVMQVPNFGIPVLNGTATGSVPATRVGVQRALTIYGECAMRAAWVCVCVRARTMWVHLCPCTHPCASAASARCSTLSLSLLLAAARRRSVERVRRGWHRVADQRRRLHEAAGHQ